jgi:CBS domain-containing protein
MTIDEPLIGAPDLTVRSVHLPVVVSDLMSDHPITVGPASTVKDIAHLLIESNIRSVPVVDIGDILVGVVSEADLISREGYPTVRGHHLSDLVNGPDSERRRQWASRAEGLVAGEIMTSEVVTCRPDETIGVVTRRLLRHDVRMLPVVDDERLVGVISRHDLLTLFDRPDSDIRRRISDLLSDPVWAADAVEFVVLDGVVTLSGSTATVGEARVLESIVQQIAGVIEVVNRIQPLT